MSVTGVMIYGCGTVAEITSAFGGTVPDRTIGFEDDFNVYQSTSNAWNRLNPTAPTRVFANPSRALNSAFQISTTRDVSVSYAVDVSATLSLSGGQQGTVTLKYADNSGFTTNVVTLISGTSGNTGTLTIGLGLTQVGTVNLSGVIPAGKFVQIVTANTTSTPTFTFRGAQEVLI